MIHPGDTLACDSVRLALWQNNPAYDYNRELVVPDVSPMDIINHWLGELMRYIFGNRFVDEYSKPVFIIIFAVAILAILWFLYKKRPELFMRSKKKTIPYTIHEDTIYGIDFAAEIDKALQAGDYKSAIRFLYLQTLKHLSDNSLIEWQLYKTPVEYIYEVKSESQRTVFRELTNRFLRVRYGNYQADRSLFDEMHSLQESVRKGGTP